MSKTIRLTPIKVRKNDGTFKTIDAIGGAGTTVTAQNIEAALGYTPANPDNYRTESAQNEIDSGLSQRIDAIETAKFPNATIVGEPLIVGSNVSRFSSVDYMIFPFILDVRGKTFTAEFTFSTGADVTTQQNILDSRFGLALAVQNGRGIMALSSSGTSWDIGVATGSTAIEPNSVYHARLTWDGTAYVGSLSTDGQTYTEDMRLTSSLGLHPETIYIGASPDIFGAGTSHPFRGGIDMGESRVTVAGLEVWHGMDDAGLTSRANVSLSNLDALGLQKFRAENLPHEDSTVGAELTKLKEEMGDLAGLQTTAKDSIVGAINEAMRVVSGGSSNINPQIVEVIDSLGNEIPFLSAQGGLMWNTLVSLLRKAYEPIEPDDHPEYENFVQIEYDGTLATIQNLKNTDVIYNGTTAMIGG